MSTAKRGRIKNQKVPNTCSQSIIWCVTRQEPTAKTVVSKILADLISKVINESETSGESWKRTDRQKNSWKAEELSYEWQMSPAEVIEESSKF